MYILSQKQRCLFLNSGALVNIWENLRYHITAFIPYYFKTIDVFQNEVDLKNRY